MRKEMYRLTRVEPSQLLRPVPPLELAPLPPRQLRGKFGLPLLAGSRGVVGSVESEGDGAYHFTNAYVSLNIKKWTRQLIIE